MRIDKEIKEKYRDKYEGLSDEKLVEEIVAEPHNEEAATYLVYVRYAPLFRKLCKDIVKDMYWFDYCLSNIFINLKSSKKDWHHLAKFKWKCTLGSYLKGMAINNFQHIVDEKKGKGEVVVSFDDNSGDKPPVQVPDMDEAKRERMEKLVMALELVQHLPSDKKFVVLKALEGYSSRDVARLLKKKWEQEGRVNMIMPTEAYVNNLKSDAMEELREMIRRE